MTKSRYQVIVIGGGHAGVEAAWAAANLFAGEPGAVAFVTLKPSKIGVMSCNPSIGGLAKGQLVREIDALGGLMGLAADASGINFKLLNTSKGAAVHGPRARCDKHGYADAVRALVEARPEIDIIEGAVEAIDTERVPGSTRRRATGVQIATAAGARTLHAGAVVLTTGTFMRGLMHTGEAQTEGGRHGEGPAVGIARWLGELGFELGRLKTGTPPRLRRSSIDWQGLDADYGDAEPIPFSDLTEAGGWRVEGDALGVGLDRFPAIQQSETRLTRTTDAAHEAIRANLHRAPMFTGQIESAGPRYCPSIEDKVVRFADRSSHGVFLEPESHRGEWVYCNGISSSLPADVQDVIVRTMPGCERAEILRYGYAVEYDMVRPHQILATGETKLIEGLFLAGQINGTSGYEEAGAQGLVAGVNAVRRVRGESEWLVGREEAYIGVLMDDLVTKTPVEPYRMFTSRAEHRLLLRADNSADRLTPVADALGLLSGTAIGEHRRKMFAARKAALGAVGAAIDRTKVDGMTIDRHIRRPGFEVEAVRAALAGGFPGVPAGVWRTAHADRKYEAFIDRQRAEVRRQAKIERKRLPATLDYRAMTSLRTEAREALTRFRPATFGQAGRLEGVTPADLTLLSVLVARPASARGAASD
ncbi:MAG: tRNA uridine-5-carboxymethylaminomethyl(34) synthesis enzyme MnmG [Planctomycetota bacterium]